MNSIVPVNPVEAVGDIVIKEGLQAVPQDDQGKQAAFEQMLVEELFLKGIFQTENSIYKPKSDEDALFNTKNNMLYQDYARTVWADHLVESGIFNEVQYNK